MDEASTIVNGRRKRVIDDVNETLDHQRKKHKSEPIRETAPSFSRRQTRSVTLAQKRYELSNREPSRLETLPIELVEKIYFYCLNVNLPRASPYLAAALSNELVYRLSILLAFWDDDLPYDAGYILDRYGYVLDDDPVLYDGRDTYPCKQDPIYNIPRILRPLGHDYVPLSSEKGRALQSGILQCKWCTSDRIRRQLPDLTRLIVTRWCNNAGYILEKDERGLGLEDYLQTEEKGPFETTARKRKQPEPKRKTGEIGTHHSCLVRLQRDCKVKFIVKMREETYDDRRLVVSLCPIVSVRVIPSFLLRGSIDSNHKGLVRRSFTDEHLELLDIIRCSGYLFSNDSSIVRRTIRNTRDITYSRDALQQGIHTAVTTLNPYALYRILLLNDFFMHPDLDGLLTTDEVPSHQFRTAAKTYVNISRDRARPGKAADKKKAKDIAFLCFCILMHFDCNCSIPYEDRFVTQLAMDVGGPFKRWLLDYLPTSPNPCDTYYDGRGILRNIICGFREKKIF